MKSVNVPRKSSNLLKRRLKIAEIVAAQGEIKVDDLSAQLGVSGVTIRGDLSSGATGIFKAIIWRCYCDTTLL
mgnify:CR=1 FL=1